MYTYGTENEEIYRDLQDEHFMAVSIDIPSVPDVVLSDSLQNSLSAMFSSLGYGYVRVTATNSIIQVGANDTAKDANYVLFPNTWYYLIAHQREKVLAFLPYSRFIEEHVRPSKEVLTAFGRKEYDNQLITDLLPNPIERRRVINFIEGNPGKNAINCKGEKYTLRGKIDIFGSALLKMLPVPDASSSFLGVVAYHLATHPDLYDKLTDELMKYPVYVKEDNNIVYQKTVRITGGDNLLVYGAPGTGKSNKLEKQYGKDMTRVVFHPEYSYFDFVGSFHPSPVYAATSRELCKADGVTFDKGEPYVDYAFVPGPFTNVLVEAWLHPEKMYNLLIEEMNRADAAAVFGDVFQLLDRDENGQSKYSITPSAEWREHLASQGLRDVMEAYGGIRIPSNMNLLATMNSADQGVNVLDTAFKRRWKYDFVQINYKAPCLQVDIEYAGKQRVWADFLERINKKLIAEYSIGEDRLVGPFFVAPDNLKTEAGREEAIKKVLFYLWDDVLRHEARSKFFGDIKTMAALYNSFQAEDVMQLYTDDDETTAKEEDTISADAGEE